MNIKTFEINQINGIVCFVKNYSNDVSTIIIGERHGNILDFSLQKEIIKMFKPEAIFYEKLKTLEWDQEKDIIKLKDDEQRDGAYDYSLDGDKIYELLKESKMKVKLKGCDLSPDQLEKEMQKFRSFVKNLGEAQVSKEFLREFESIYRNHLRENKMGKNINSSTNFKRKVVILGNNHVTKVSNIYNHVKSDYISIYIDDICHNCGEMIEEESQNDDKCRNCGSIRRRYVEIEKYTTKNTKL